MFYSGLTADENALTDDGYNLKWFFFLMGTGFLVIPLAVSLGILTWVLFKRKRIAELVATGKQARASGPQEGSGTISKPALDDAARANVITPPFVEGSSAAEHLFGGRSRVSERIMFRAPEGGFMIPSSPPNLAAFGVVKAFKEVKEIVLFNLRRGCRAGLELL